MVRIINTESLYIMGLAHEYPPYSFGPEDLEKCITRIYPDHAASIGLQKLIQLNQETQIQSRRSVSDFSKWTREDATPPMIDELSKIYQSVGIDLAVTACKKAMQEARVSTAGITHVVAVTCTNQGNPGYDLLVCQQLKLTPTVQRVLLHGVGCAGGLSALRTAASIVAAETQRGRPARVLVVACELCSLFLRKELQVASQDKILHIAPALFSDAAAALVVCNSIALEKQHKPIFELLECGSMIVPGTTDFMKYDVQADGMVATLTKDIPRTAIGAIRPMLDQLRAATAEPQKPDSWTTMQPSSFDWAIHPGGAAILQGAQQGLRLTEDHIRASLETYHHYGNSSSPTVLIVLDKLRRMGKGREHVVATSFGPGMMIEMCIMRRCQELDHEPPLSTKSGKKYIMWLALQSRLTRYLRRSATVQHVTQAKHKLGPIAA